MNSEVLKYFVVVVILGVGVSQTINRTKNLTRVEERLLQESIQNTITDSLMNVANQAEARADSVESVYLLKSSQDSIIIENLQKSINILSRRADSIAVSLSESLANVDLDLEQEFIAYRTVMDSSLTAALEQVEIERKAKEDANDRALLWQRSSELKDNVIASQTLQIQQLQSAVDAAVSAANPGWLPRLQADWWIAVAGFGLGILATQ